MIFDWSYFFIAILTIGSFLLGFSLKKEKVIHEKQEKFESKRHVSKEKVPVVEKFRIYNDELEILLSTDGGKDELIRYVFNEAALAGSIDEIAEAVINLRDDEDEKQLREKLRNKVNDSFNAVRKGFSQHKDKLVNKLLNTGNSMVSNFVSSDEE